MTSGPSARGPGLSAGTIGVVVGLCVGLLGVVAIAAIAVPRFLSYGTLAKQAEVKTRLKLVFAGEVSFFIKNRRYSDVVEDIGFVPVAGSRYVYLLNAAPTLAPVVAFDPSPAREHTGIDADERSSARVTREALEHVTPPNVWQDLGVHGCPEACAMTAVAGSNLDADATIDVWSISTKERVIDGVTVPAGTPFNHVDDVRN